MGQINLVGAFGGLNFERIAEGEVEIAKGTTEVDLSNGASFAGVLADFDLIVLQVSGELLNNSAKYTDYVGFGGIWDGIDKIYGADVWAAAEKTISMDKESFWFPRRSRNTWGKSYRSYNTTYYTYQVNPTSNPLRICIEEGYLSGKVSYVAYGCRFAMLDAAASGGSGGSGDLGDGEEIEVPPTVDVDGEAGLL